MSAAIEKPARRRLASLTRAGMALGLQRSRIYELIAARELTIVKIGSRTLISVESLDALIERQRERAAEDGRVVAPPLAA